MHVEHHAGIAHRVGPGGEFPGAPAELQPQVVIAVGQIRDEPGEGLGAAFGRVRVNVYHAIHDAEDGLFGDDALLVDEDLPAAQIAAVKEGFKAVVGSGPSGQAGKQGGEAGGEDAEGAGEGQVHGDGSGRVDEWNRAAKGACY